MKRLIIAAAMAMGVGGACAQSEDPLRYVKLETSKGDIVLQLNAQLAPKTVENFLAYVEEGFYDGTIFHRIISNFMIQGGGYTKDLKKKPTRVPIANEADNMLPNKNGAIAMARTAHPHSATSQFFINVADNVALNHAGKTNSRAWGYAVFGEVHSGLEVVEEIRMAETGPQGRFRGDVPKEPIVIRKAVVLDGPPAAPVEEIESAQIEEVETATPE